MKLEFQKELKLTVSQTVSVHFTPNVVTNGIYHEQTCCQVFTADSLKIKAPENLFQTLRLYSVKYSWLNKLKFINDILLKV